jgi:hypothetical protein
MTYGGWGGWVREEGEWRRGEDYGLHMTNDLRRA